MKKLIAVAVLFLCFTTDVQAAGYGCSGTARPLRRAGAAVVRVVGRVVVAPFRASRERQAARQAARACR